MRYKKIITIAVCVVLITSSLSGFITSYAKNNTVDNASNKKEKTEELQTIDASDPDITALEPEVAYQDDQDNSRAADSITDIPSDNQMQNVGTGSTGSDEDILTGGTETVTIISNNAQAGDLYNFNAEDIDRLLKEGYSVQDIIDSDEIGNQIGIDPTDLLKMKKGSKKDLKEIRDDILKDRKEKVKEYLKNKYPDAYKKLKDKNLSDDEISCFFGEMDVNDVQPTDELISGYVAQGDKVFQEQKDSKDDKDNKDNSYKDNNDNTSSDEVTSEEVTQYEEGNN